MPHCHGPEPELGHWLAEQNEQIYNIWKSEFPHWRQGFKIFYGRPLAKPTLTVISLNPGGDEESFRDDKKNFEIGKFCTGNDSYVDGDYAFADKLRIIFGRHLGLMRDESIAFPVFCFRGQNWKAISKSGFKKAMKTYAFPLSKKIIEKMPSSGLIVVGLQTNGYLTERIIGHFDDEQVVDRRTRNDHVLVKCSKWGGVSVFTTHHLTPAQQALSAEELDRIKKRLDEWLSENHFS